MVWINVLIILQSCFQTLISLAAASCAGHPWGPDKYANYCLFISGLHLKYFPAKCWDSYLFMNLLWLFVKVKYLMGKQTERIDRIKQTCLQSKFPPNEQITTCQDTAPGLYCPQQSFETVSRDCVVWSVVMSSCIINDTCYAALTGEYCLITQHCLVNNINLSTQTWQTNVSSVELATCLQSISWCSIVFLLSN